MAKNISKLFKYQNFNFVSYRTSVSGKENGQKLNHEDVMGLPDSKSNLRALKMSIPSDESREEKEYRFERERLQLWNQEYWEKHNNLFKIEKNLFIKNQLEKLAEIGQNKKTLDVEDMAVFYKEFLNKNYDKHIGYNWEWYGKNFAILWLSLKAEISKIRKRK